MTLGGVGRPVPEEELVTVGEFASPIEAQMAKGMLESSGVACFLAGENVNNLMVGMFETLTTVQVKVEDAGAARELLGRAGEMLAGDSGGAS